MLCYAGCLVVQLPLSLPLEKAVQEVGEPRNPSDKEQDKEHKYECPGKGNPTDSDNSTQRQRTHPTLLQPAAKPLDTKVKGR